MNWINLNVSVLDSEEFLGATPTERATWLCLLRYCVGQENSGVIEGAGEWKDRKWQQVVRITGKEVSSKCDLWRFESGNLLLMFYPADKEEEVRRNRANGAKGGRPAKPKVKPKGNHPVLDGIAEWFDSAETERKEKGMEGNGSTPKPPDGGSGRRVLPERWRNIPKQDRKNHRVQCNNRLMERIGRWFGRKPETLWTLAEAIALHDIKPGAEDLELLESWYFAEDVGDRDIRRQDLMTLLNNWTIDLDRARIWKAANP